MRQPGNPETGFTLVELLVVIAIIGILAALTLSAVSGAKSRAVEMIDVNNLKQITLAVQLYVSDNRDFLPWANWLSGDHTGRPGWLYAMDPTLSGPSQFVLNKGLLWPMVLHPQLYMCPMDATNTQLFAERDQQLSSYAINGAIVGYNRANFPAQKSSSMLPEDVAFWETDGTQPDYFNDGANLPSEGVSGRHFNGAVNSSFSGSVSWVRLGAWYLEVYDTNKNSLWCYPGSTDGR
jgi:prepilin-type N-terminal cleavage/methylation domain-containing protein